MTLFCSASVYCHKSPITFSTRQIHDPSISVLDIDIERYTSVIVPRGTYRIATKDGITNKYVTLILDGKVTKMVVGFTCFYYKNYDDTYDRVACVDFKNMIVDINL